MKDQKFKLEPYEERYQDELRSMWNSGFRFGVFIACLLILIVFWLVRWG